VIEIWQEQAFMNDQNQKTLSIVGGGLSGLLTAFYLVQERKARSLPLPRINLFVSPLYPSCTLSSTATVALRGTKKGLSPLGDQLVDAFHEVERFLSEQKSHGAYPAELSTFNHPMSPSFEKVSKRYHNHAQTKETHGFLSFKEKAFLFSPFHFTAWLYKNLLPNVNFIQETVSSLDGLRLFTLEGNSYLGDQIIFAAGAYNSLMTDDDRVKKSLPVAGSYLEFMADLGEESFCHTYNELNCVYLAQDKKIFFGSVSQEGFWLSPDIKSLKERYDEWQNSHLTRLPPFDEAICKTGIREKGRKREPYVYSLNKEKNQWIIGGMYKNGYSLAFLLGKKLAHLVNDQL
jgi:hypothetical protein